eukprot:s1840_g7.t1
MGACGNKAALTQSREVRVSDLRNSYQYTPLNDDNDGATASIPLATTNEKLDIVQFASAIFVAGEGQDFFGCQNGPKMADWPRNLMDFSISVMRLGQLEDEVRCHFRTEDGSGKAGYRYEHAEGWINLGELVFEKGVFEKSIPITIVESPLWSATLEFKVILENPVQCQLGKYLKICRVKVIDQDEFPSGFYAKETAEDVPIGLFIEYVKLALEQPGNTWRFLVTVIFDQVRNAYIWFTLKVSVYLVNVVFGHRADAEEELLVRDDPEKTAQVIGLMYVLLPLLLHIWKVTKTKLDLKGRCKLFLQTSVMRKYMNYSAESRREVTQPEVVAFVMQKSDHLAGGISEVSSLLETLGKLVMLNYFAVSSNPDMTWAVITMPVVMIFWSLLRDSQYVCTKPPEPSKKPILNFVSEICDNYSIIAYYFQRPAMNEKFASRVTTFNDNGIPEEVYKMNSEFFFDWLAPLFVGLYIAFYSPLVLSEDLPLGTFLATISVFREVSANFVDGYRGLKKVVSCFEPLVDLTVFLNRQTDVPLLKRFVDQRDHDHAADWNEGSGFPDGFDTHSNNGHQLFEKINLAVPQGKLVALTGLAGSGKSRLLNMLAGDVQPTSGRVLVPMATTPLQNLFFGDPSAVAEFEERHRMFWILDKLKMSNVRNLAEQEISLLQEAYGLDDEISQHGECGCGPCHVEESLPADLWMPEEGDGSRAAAEVRRKLAGWRNSLSFQEKAKLHVARALIMNPEILILEKPLMKLASQCVLKLMRVIFRDYC